MHPWIGAGSDDRERLLAEIGKDSVDELFSCVPDELLVPSIPLPGAQSEHEVEQQLRAMAARNLTGDTRPTFLGAGVYRHLQPALVDAVIGRSEFLTSYTPYQPEISQGTLQAIYEFQTLLCQLTGCEVANASLYDGATALVEAVLMCHRLGKAKLNRVVVAETVHPLYRRVLNTYTDALGLEVVVLPAGSDGMLDTETLQQAVAAEDACCVVVQSPNFLGIVEPLPSIAEIAHSHSTLAVQLVCEAVSLGLLKGGGSFGFDVVCGEAQSFGLTASFGGPHLGFFTCSQRHIRQIPGRLVGETRDSQGRRAFCLTLATREQHIRRAKATSNICTNHGLMALAATVWLELVGGTGLRELASSCLARSQALQRRLREGEGRYRLAFPHSPTFNEFLMTGPGSGEQLVERLAAHNILAGVPARKWGGSWPDGVLVATTELTSVNDINVLAATLESEP